MLKKFLIDNREEILAIGRAKTKELAEAGPTSPQMTIGLPLFFDQLVAVLDRRDSAPIDTEIVSGAAEHGKELQRLGFTLSHVVHAYGSICQAVTECAQQKAQQISSGDFNVLNRCLDIAISAAVSEFQHNAVIASEEHEVQHLGALVHELRNALSSATIAFDMIRSGLVGTGGSTGAILGENLSRMRNLIDRSLSDVRMRTDPHIQVEPYSLVVLVDQLVSTARLDKKSTNVEIGFEVDPALTVSGDRQLMLSALANLIQNALKHTKPGGHVGLRAAKSGNSVVLEVEDECGGIDEKSMASLFKPFSKGSGDQSGLGLGLTIVQRAIRLSEGTITVKNNPGKGCVFQIKLPLVLNPSPPHPSSVPGRESIQPKARKE